MWCKRCHPDELVLPGLPRTFWHWFSDMHLDIHEMPTGRTLPADPIGPYSEG